MQPLQIDNLKINIPIIQGGMGVGISLSGLAAAVANEGGVGIIAANVMGILEDDYLTNYAEAGKRRLRMEIRKARKLTNGILGVNIMVAMQDYFELVSIAIEEKIDIIFMGAGLPTQSLPFDKIKKAGIKIVPIISSEKAARVIFKYWKKKYNRIPDAVVVEGPLAGGHLGFNREELNDPAITLETIVPKVISALKPFEEDFNRKIPVIAAGGIFTGADILKYINLGVQGVQMATRFVATHECDASIEFKNAYLNCKKKEDIIIIDSPVGMPGRAINNSFLEEVSRGERKPFKCPCKCLKTCTVKNAPYCIANALNNARKGNMKEGFVFAGSNAYRVNKILSVKELINTLLLEYKNAKYF